MKKTVTIFLIILLTKICCFSQSISQDTIVSITSSQLKTANLVFVDHNRLLQENQLLNSQIYNYQMSIDNLVKTDSLRMEQINNYQKVCNNYALQVQDLNAAVRRRDQTITYWKVGGITVSVGVLLFLLIK